MEIDLQQEPSRAQEVTFAHDLISDDEEEEVQWELGDTLLTLRAEAAATKGALESLLLVHDIPEEEMPLHPLFSPIKDKSRIVETKS